MSAQPVGQQRLHQGEFLVRQVTCVALSNQGISFAVGLGPGHRKSLVLLKSQRVEVREASVNCEIREISRFRLVRSPLRIGSGQALRLGQGSTMSDSVIELRVSAHVMTLDRGLFCLYPADGSGSKLIDGLPNVCVTPTPGSSPDALKIATFRNDGWLDGGAVLVWVMAPRGRIVVTIYQDASQAAAPPRIQVLRLQNENDLPDVAVVPSHVGKGKQTASREVVAHIQEAGDVAGDIGAWIGERGSKQWIEGFGISPDQLAADELEYQVLLGRDWYSPWVKGGEFCGSRGMALPLLGFRVRLIGNSAAEFEVNYSATFVDGTACGPVSGGALCEAPTRAQLEAFRLTIRPRPTLA
jgi:hypothetical protein